MILQFAVVLKWLQETFMTCVNIHFSEFYSNKLFLCWQRETKTNGAELGLIRPCQVKRHRRTFTTTKIKWVYVHIWASMHTFNPVWITPNSFFLFFLKVIKDVCCTTVQRNNLKPPHYPNIHAHGWVNVIFWPQLQVLVPKKNNFWDIENMKFVVFFLHGEIFI